MEAEKKNMLTAAILFFSNFGMREYHFVVLSDQVEKLKSYLCSNCIC